MFTTVCISMCYIIYVLVYVCSFCMCYVVCVCDVEFRVVFNHIYKLCVYVLLLDVQTILRCMMRFSDFHNMAKQIPRLSRPWRFSVWGSQSPIPSLLPFAFLFCPWQCSPLRRSVGPGCLASGIITCNVLGSWARGNFSRLAFISTA